MTDEDTAAPSSEYAVVFGSSRAERAAALRRSLRLTALSTILPGAGLRATRWRAAGTALAGLFLTALVILIGVLVLMGPRRAGLWLAARPSLLHDLALFVTAFGLAWCAAIAATAWLTRPARLDRAGRGLHVAVTAALVAAVAVPTWWLQGNARVTSETLVSVFRGSGAGGPDEGAVDPWADISRVSVLLLGSDAGAGRDGVRTDSMMVASVDTRTGNTVLFGLPRNLFRAPLPADNPIHADYPNGYYCPGAAAGDECMLNGLWSLATSPTYKSRFADPANAGRDTVRGSISLILGIPIDYTVVVDMAGFEQLVNAMGGVDVNVVVPPNPYGWTSIPIGAHLGAGGVPADVPDPGDAGMWIPSGSQHLNGFQAQWYARFRVADSDFGRMRRQRCLLGAILRNVNPGTMLTKYDGIARAAKDNLSTDIAVEHLPAFVALVERIRAGTITSLPLTSDNIDTRKPDFDAIHAMVEAALTTSTATPTTATTTPTSTRTATPTSTRTKRSTGSTRPSGSATNTPGVTPSDPATAEDVKDAC